MTTSNTRTCLQELKIALHQKDVVNFGKLLGDLTELEPERWVRLLHLNNIIPEPATRDSEFRSKLSFLMESAQHANANSAFPNATFVKLLLPLMSLNVIFSSISTKLEELNVWDKPIVNLIIRLVAYLEDQTNLIYNRIEKQTEEKGYFDGREFLNAQLPTRFGGPATNYVAAYEETCENLQLILAYALSRYRSDYWGTIEPKKSPYEDLDFTNLLVLASIWRRYKELWANIKYFDWYPTQVTHSTELGYYQPVDKDEHTRFEIGGIRMQQIIFNYAYYASSVGLDEAFSDTEIELERLAQSIDLPEVGQPWNAKIDTSLFKSIAVQPWDKIHWQIIFQIGHYEQLLDALWIGSQSDHLDWKTYWELFSHLRLLARVLLLKSNQEFSIPLNQDQGLAVFKRIFLIETEILANLLSGTTSIQHNICIRFLNAIMFDPKLKNLEIWDTPLLNVGGGLILVSPVLIINGSPLRAVENFIAQWNPDLFDRRGKILEQELFQYLKQIPNVQVQDGVRFKGEDNKEVECDLVVWWEKTLILIEVKCRKSIQDPGDAFYAKQQVEKAIDQLVTRRNSVVNNWDNFRESASELRLPDKIVTSIRLVAITNNPHFTGWKSQEVIVTDEFCVRRFFGKAEIEAFAGEKNLGTIGRIRMSEFPNVREFFEYLDDPPQVQTIREGLKVDPLPFPLVKDTDPKIAIFHLSYNARTYGAEVRKKQNDSNHHRSKIQRNDPCPCGSGLKHKKCCGNKKKKFTSHKV